MKPVFKGILLCLCAVVILSSCDVGKTISEVQDAAKNAVDSIPMPKIEAPSVVAPDDSDVGDFDSIEEINAKSKNYNKFEITAGYDSLESDTQRYFYERLVADVYVVGNNKNDKGLYSIDKIYLNDSLDESEIRVVLSAYKNDHPEVFWLSNQFAYIPYDNTEIQLYSVISPDDIKKKSEELITAIKFFMNKIPAGLSEFERELKIHDLLLSTCVYNDTVETTSDDWRPFSIYGALVSGSAVCEGYSKAIQYLMSMFGIECNTLNGMGRGNPHQWNTVKIDGEWYHLDATWNDTTDSNIYYDYFNVSDEVLLYDHEIAPMFTDLSFNDICGTESSEAQLFNIYVPKCTSTLANFYARNAVLYDGENEECNNRIEQQLQSCIDNRETIVYIMVDSSIDYNEAINLLFYEQPYQFFQCIANINMVNGGVVNDEYVSVLKKDKQSIIEVHIEYN